MTSTTASDTLGGSDAKKRSSARAPKKPKLLYRVIRGTMRAVLKVFYGTIEATGLERLDPTVPTILASNHPNSIVDPLLLGLFEERQIAFCARDGLFRIPVFGRVLRSVGAIPIRRRSEHAGGADNNDAFAAARKVLDAGGVMAIFPEGKTHGNLRIEPVKTGTARIALSTELANTDEGLRVVPIGVTYLVRHAFRSDVHVAFGEPIIVSKSQLEASPADDPRNVRALTERIGTALRNLAVHIDKTEDERLIAQVTSIIVGIRVEAGLDESGQSPAERTALVRRVVDAYKWISEVEPEKTQELRERIDRFVEEREELGLGGERPALQHRGERVRKRTRAGHALFMVGGAPLALLGLVTSMPPYLLLRAAIRALPLSTDRIALFKLLGGAALFGAAYAAEVALALHFGGPLAAALLGVALVPAALFARRYAIEVRLHRLHLGIFRRSKRLEKLREERKSLSDELAALRERYLAHLSHQQRG